MLPFSSEPTPLSGLEKVEHDLEAAITKLETLIASVRAPLPTETGDGSQLPEKTQSSGLSGLLRDFSKFNVTDWKTLLDTVQLKIDGDPIDDKTYYMERMIRETAKLDPQSSMLGNALSNGLMSQLWNDLQHPPISYLGSQYKYRTADGSNNNYRLPDLGKAGTPYARSVKAEGIQPTALPDPGLIFDCLMARSPENTEPHPNKISSVLFYFASIIIHDLFRTDHKEWGTSLTSSYLDLSPLYGSNQDEQDAMRTKKDGKIKPDCYSEKRLMGFPPGCSILLIMFNRFHNYVVEQLALINEGSRFNKPPPPGAPFNPHASTAESYDEDLFQTGRLITCGLYVNMILMDYVSTILNLNKTNETWHLDPRRDVQGLPVATGNQVSAEFNLVYRWHSAISEKDERWIEEAYAKIFPHQDPAKMSLSDFVKGLEKLEKNIKDDPAERDYFPGQSRDSKTGFYGDDFLVESLASAIEDPANSFGAQRVPTIMRAVEIMGMYQARSWQLASLNEFRKFFDLEPHATFESINSDPVVADQLRHLYDTPDHVELYPGLVAEEAKQPLVPGAGLCPGFTTSRAILSDATALVRGDRFYTVDYTPKALTNWGFNLVQSDNTINGGGVMYNLVLRAFPNHFKPDSVYAHYPFTLPKEMESVLGVLGRKSRYSFERPKRMDKPVVILTHAAAKSVLLDQVTFGVPWGPALEKLMGPLAKEWCLAGDKPVNAESRRKQMEAMYPKGWEKEIKTHYISLCEILLKDKQYTLGGSINAVDIVRDIGNLAPVHLAADMFLLPLKTKQHPTGPLTEAQLYLILLGLFADIFLDVDPVASMGLRQKAQDAAAVLGSLVNLETDDSGFIGFFKHLMHGDHPHRKFPLPSYGSHLIEEFREANPKFVTGYVLTNAAASVVTSGQIFGQLIDFFLNGAGKEHLPAMRELALKDDSDDASFDNLKKYIIEGMRLAGETAVLRTVKKTTVVEDGPDRKYTLNVNDTVMVEFLAAHRDPTVFPDPDSFRLDRDPKQYIGQGYGPHKCIGAVMSQVCLTALFKVILRNCPGLRAAPGPQGRMAKVANPLSPYERPDVKYHKFFTVNGDSYWPMPTTLKVHWDRDLIDSA